MKRLFRVYSHVYHQHFNLIEQLAAVAHLNTSVRIFLISYKFSPYFLSLNTSFFLQMNLN